MDKDSQRASVFIRKATARDQRAVREMIWTAHLFPFRLHWSTFLVAENNGRVVGVGQIRAHRDGCRELASIAVHPAYQRHKIGGTLVATLLAQEIGPVHLMCAEELEPFYARFGFSTIAVDCAPPSLGCLVRFGNWMLAPYGWIMPRRRNILIMRCTPSTL